MKKIIILAIIVLTTMTSFAQSQLEGDETIVNKNIDNSTIPVTYRLFPTQNMWTFIKLNTRTGQMWQVQYDVKDNNRFETDLNTLPLVNKEKELNNRFTLYSTQNTWTFLLLDQIDGKIWQVQWAVEPENRVVIPIE